MLGKVPNMAQEMMGSTVLLSKGDLEEILEEHVDDPKEITILDR